jgi:hypothetical protein
MSFLFEILILLMVICKIRSYPEINTTYINNCNNYDDCDFNYFEDNLNLNYILPIVICLYFINIII